MVDYQKLIELTIAGIVGISGKYGIDFFKNKRQSKRIDFDTILKRLDREIGELKEERVTREKERYEMQTRIFQLENQLIALRNKIILLESAHMDSPLPMWLKDTDGTMLALNKPYETLILKPIGKTTEDYIGKNDLEFWGDTIGKIYMDNDEWVMENKKVWKGIEPLRIKGKMDEIVVFKYPRYSSKILIGTAGIAVPKSWIIDANK